MRKKWFQNFEGVAGGDPTNKKMNVVKSKMTTIF